MKSRFNFRSLIKFLLVLMVPLIATLSLPQDEVVKAQEAPRTAFVHLFEWKWTDIAQECEDVLGPKGFSAVQVSPPMEHAWFNQGGSYPWWLRYQPVSYEIESRSGTRAEFTNMVSRCNAVGVDIYVDAIINHMTGVGSSSGYNGTQYWEYHYPSTGYGTDNFHHCGRNGNDDISNYQDVWEVQNCELVNLTDLATDTGYVQDKIAAYMNDLISLGVAGFRLDASKHMATGDINAIIAKLDGDPYIFQEVIDQGGEPITADLYFQNGDVTEFKYSVKISEAFYSGQLSWLSNFGVDWGFMPDDKGVVFVDNHDNQRGHGGGGHVITYKDSSLYDLTNIFMLAWPYGYPKVMSSYEFDDSDQGPPQNVDGSIQSVESLGCFGHTDDSVRGWVCEHRWRPIANMVMFRNITSGQPVSNWWDNGNDQISFSRGDKGFVAINKEGSELSQSFQTGMAAGTYCDIISGDLDNGNCTGNTVTVNGDGTANITVAAGSAVAFYAANATPVTPVPTATPDPNANITIHYKGWSSPNIYAWSTDGSETKLRGDWPGSSMSDEGNGWYGDSFNETSINLIFNSGSNQTDDLSRTTGEWWYMDNQWYDHNPVGTATPTSEPGDGVKVHYKGWSNPNVYAWSTDGNETKLRGDWPGSSMSDEGNGWYGDSFNETSINLIFNSGSNQTDDLSRTTGEWWYDGSWHNTKPGGGSSGGGVGLGALYTPSSTTFRIWSPDSSNVVVYVDGNNHNLQHVADFDGYTNIYEVTVSGDLKLAEYQLKINGNDVRDPYGAMVVPGTNRNVVLDMASIQPDGGWASHPTLIEREDAVVYEAHVRDFTLHDSSGVSANKRGKFLGMVETGTTYNGLATGIDHLKELGVTHVQILPFYDFSTPQYNWGYDPINFNVPEEQYSLTPNDYENRVKELQTMINEFHKNGIRVIMDVVYNHTFDDSVFENITGQYYTGNNDSGCGNGIDTGNQMVSRMIQDSLEYWIENYHVDGFRFDLMGIFHYEAVNSWGEHLNGKYASRNLLMYGEPWNGYWGDPIENQKVRMGNVPAMASGRMGVFNGKFREAIKGDNDGTGRGYMFNYGDKSWEIEVGSRGGILHTKSTNTLSNMWDPMFAFDPEQSVNYISAHDNYCLWDKVKHSGEDNDYGKRVVRFGEGIVLTSQGIPFIHAGDEMLRTKVYNGDWEYAHNSYNAPDDYNMIRWEWKEQNADMFNYHKDLIALRKAHPGFRLNTWDEINNNMNTYRDGKVVVSQINADANGDSWDEIIIVYNPGNNYDVSLPDGTWTKVFDINGAVNVGGLSGSATTEGTAVTIFKK